MKKILIAVLVILAVSVIRGDLMGQIQAIDTLVQQGKYSRAESRARRLLNDPNITDQERASIQNILNEIATKKEQSKKPNNTEARNKEAQEAIDQVLSQVGQTGEQSQELVQTQETADTGTVAVGANEDVSTEQKFESYDSYEQAAITKGGGAIYSMSQLYFRDGLYERARNVAKRDKTGDIRNYYVVAVTSRLMGDWDQAIDYYNRILAISPNHSEAKLGLGIAYKSKGEFNKALDYLVASNKTSEVNRAISELREIIASK